MVISVKCKEVLLNQDIILYLEIQGAVLAIRLAKTIRIEIKCEKVVSEQIQHTFLEPLIICQILYYLSNYKGNEEF